MDSQIEAMSAAVETLNIADDTVGEWPMEVIEKCIDASIWKDFKDIIFGSKRLPKVSEIKTIEIAQWAVENGLELELRGFGKDADLVSILVEKGYVDVLEYLYSKGLIGVHIIVIIAFKTEGSMEIIKWLHATGMMWKYFSDQSEVYHTAIRLWRVDICKWAFSEKILYSWETYQMARSCPLPKIREWGMSLPDPWDLEWNREWTRMRA
jgi:hypothetical protein